jgi:hypothetical protein
VPPEELQQQRAAQRRGGEQVVHPHLGAVAGDLVRGRRHHLAGHPSGDEPAGVVRALPLGPVVGEDGEAVPLGGQPQRERAERVVPRADPLPGELAGQVGPDEVAEVPGAEGDPAPLGQPDVAETLVE